MKSNKNTIWILNEYKRFFNSLTKDLEKLNEFSKSINNTSRSNKLKKIALALFAIPEPTHISDIVALSLVLYEVFRRKNAFNLLNEIREINLKIRSFRTY